jgi:hypothetical protein
MNTTIWMQDMKPLPNGPSIDTVGRAERVVCRPLIGSVGCMIEKLTSGGIDTGSRPIFELLVVEAENARRGVV